MRDKIGNYEDWKDGHDAFRQRTVRFIKDTMVILESLKGQLIKLETILKESRGVK